MANVTPVVVNGARHAAAQAADTVAIPGPASVGSTLLTAVTGSGLPAGLRLPASTGAPSSPDPVDGDMWTTTAGLFVRINGVTKTVAFV